MNIYFSLDNRYTHLWGVAAKQGRQRNHLQELQFEHWWPLHPAFHKLQIFLRLSGDVCVLLSENGMDSFRQAERKTSDIVQCPWQHSDQSEDKFREVIQKLSLLHFSLRKSFHLDRHIYDLYRWVTQWHWTTPLAPKLPEPPRFRRCGQTQPLDIFTALTLRRWVQKRLWKTVFYSVILSVWTKFYLKCIILFFFLNRQMQTYLMRTISTFLLIIALWR